MAKNPEGSDPQEMFLDEFKRIGAEKILRGYEAKNRERLKDAPLEVLSAFDSKWKELTGKRYIQTVTTAPMAMPPMDGKNDTVRGDPKSMNYRQPIDFKVLGWVKVRKKVRKRLTDFYDIEGTPVQGAKRPIYTNLSREQLFNLLGDKIAKQILADAKGESKGAIELEDPIELQVEGYWEVQFAPQKDQNDTKDVRLCVDNTLLRFLRMTPVVVNGFHLEDADNALRDVIKHDGPDGRKIVGKVQKHPYTVLRPATLEEFVARLNEGNEAQREFERKREESN